jgi:hypothetical protein
MTDIPPDALRARELYLAGATMDRIRAETGLSSWTAYRWIDGRGVSGAPPLPALPRRRPLMRRSRRIAKNERAALVARMMRAADLQVIEIEQRLAQAGQEGQEGHVPADREREARVLAVLAKTLRELIALDALHDNEKPKARSAARRGVKPDRDGDDDVPPRNLDELRLELSRRLDRLVGEAKTSCPVEPDGI